VRRPGIHHAAAFLKQIAAPIGGLSTVTDYVRQRGFGHLTREACALGRLVAKRGSEAMRRQVVAAHAPQHHQHGHVRQLFSSPVARKDKMGASESLHLLEHRNGRTG
jgi:hypothetical protein